MGKTRFERRETRPKTFLNKKEGDLNGRRQRVRVCAVQDDFSTWKSVQLVPERKTDKFEPLVPLDPRPAACSHGNVLDLRLVWRKKQQEVDCQRRL
jgi:hypothetical protein